MKEHDIDDRGLAPQDAAETPKWEEALCPECGGTGVAPGGEACAQCQGTGRVESASAAR